MIEREKKGCDWTKYSLFSYVIRVCDFSLHFAIYCRLLLLLLCCRFDAFVGSNESGWTKLLVKPSAQSVMLHTVWRGEAHIAQAATSS